MAASAATTDTSVGVDDAFGVHLLFASQGDLFYGHRPPRGDWALEVAAGEGEATAFGPFNAMAVAGDGVVHAGFYDATNDRMMYGRRPPGGPWETELVDGLFDVGRDNDIALDADGGVHVVYRDFTNRDVRYASRPAGASAWAVELVDSADDVGQFAAIALDVAGLPHVSYRDGTSDDLKYAVRSVEGGWTTEVVDVGDGSDTDISVDSVGGVHVSYVNGLGQIRYARRAPAGGWALELADADGGIHTALQLDPGGNVHIAYHATSVLALRRAFRPPSGGWSLEVVDDDGNAGRHVSMTIDRGGALRIAYVDQSDGDVMHAERCP